MAGWITAEFYRDTEFIPSTDVLEHLGIDESNILWHDPFAISEFCKKLDGRTDFVDVLELARSLSYEESLFECDPKIYEAALILDGISSSTSIDTDRFEAAKAIGTDLEFLIHFVELWNNGLIPGSSTDSGKIYICGRKGDNLELAGCKEGICLLGLLLDKNPQFQRYRKILEFNPNSEEKTEWLSQICTGVYRPEDGLPEVHTSTYFHPEALRRALEDHKERNAAGELTPRAVKAIEQETTENRTVFLIDGERYGIEEVPDDFQYHEFLTTLSSETLPTVRDGIETVMRYAEFEYDISTDTTPDVVSVAISTEADTNLPLFSQGWNRDLFYIERELLSHGSYLKAAREGENLVFIFRPLGITREELLSEIAESVFNLTERQLKEESQFYAGVTQGRTLSVNADGRVRDVVSTTINGLKREVGIMMQSGIAGDSRVMIPLGVVAPNTVYDLTPWGSIVRRIQSPSERTLPELSFVQSAISALLRESFRATIALSNLIPDPWDESEQVEISRGNAFAVFTQNARLQPIGGPGEVTCGGEPFVQAAIESLNLDQATMKLLACACHSRGLIPVTEDIADLLGLSFSELEDTAQRVTDAEIASFDHQTGRVMVPWEVRNHFLGSGPNTPGQGRQELLTTEQWEDILRQAGILGSGRLISLPRIYEKAKKENWRLGKRELVYISARQRVLAKGGSKLLSENPALVLLLINRLREEGQSHEFIESTLHKLAKKCQNHPKISMGLHYHAAKAALDSERTPSNALLLAAIISNMDPDEIEFFHIEDALSWAILHPEFLDYHETSPTLTQDLPVQIEPNVSVRQYVWNAIKDIPGDKGNKLRRLFEVITEDLRDQTDPLILWQRIEPFLKLRALDYPQQVELKRCLDRIVHLEQSDSLTIEVPTEIRAATEIGQTAKISIAAAGAFEALRPKLQDNILVEAAIDTTPARFGLNPVRCFETDCRALSASLKMRDPREILAAANNLLFTYLMLSVNNKLPEGISFEISQSQLNTAIASLIRSDLTLFKGNEDTVFDLSHTLFVIASYVSRDTEAYGEVTRSLEVARAVLLKAFQNSQRAIIRKLEISSGYTPTDRQVRADPEYKKMCGSIAELAEEGMEDLIDLESLRKDVQFPEFNDISAEILRLLKKKKVKKKNP